MRPVKSEDRRVANIFEATFKPFVYDDDVELGDKALYQQAQVLAQMGDRESAITALEQARAVGDGGLIYARNDPMLDPLRSEPQFARMLQGMGFDGGTA